MGMKKIKLLSSLLLICFFSTTSYAQNTTDVPMARNESHAGNGSKAAENIITVDFTNADIQSVLEVMAVKGDVNIVSAPDVEGVVNIQLRDVSWRSAFETILSTYGLIFEKDGNIYQVFSPASLEERQLEDVGTKVVTLEYATLEQVRSALSKTLSSTGQVESIEGTNQIVISDTSTNLRRARSLLEQIDVKMPQVLIDTRIVETELREGESMGLDWNLIARAAGGRRPTTFPFMRDAGNNWLDSRIKKAGLIPTGQTQILNTSTSTSTGAQSQSQDVDFPFEFGFPFVERDDFTFGTLDFSQMSVVFSMLESRKNTKVISNPRIVTLNHQSAVVQVGGETGIPTFERNETTGVFVVTGFEMRRFGIVLEVTPHISKKNEITVEIKPEITTPPIYQEITPGLAAPQFQTITAETSVMVHSGDTIVIGGLISDIEDDERSKVPYLHKIPILGWAFKAFSRDPNTNNKSETIFFVTVTLLDDVYNKKEMAAWKKRQEDYEAFRKESEDEFLEEEEEQKD